MSTLIPLTLPAGGLTRYGLSCGELVVLARIYNLQTYERAANGNSALGYADTTSGQLCAELGYSPSAMKTIKNKLIKKGLLYLFDGTVGARKVRGHLACIDLETTGKFLSENGVADCEGIIANLRERQAAALKDVQATKKVRRDNLTQKGAQPEIISLPKDVLQPENAANEPAQIVQTDNEKDGSGNLIKNGEVLVDTNQRFPILRTSSKIRGCRFDDGVVPDLKNHRLSSEQPSVDGKGGYSSLNRVPPVLKIEYQRYFKSGTALDIDIDNSENDIELDNLLSTAGLVIYQGKELNYAGAYDWCSLSKQHIVTAGYWEPRDGGAPRVPAQTVSDQIWQSSEAIESGDVFKAPITQQACSRLLVCTCYLPILAQAVCEREGLALPVTGEPLCPALAKVLNASAQSYQAYFGIELKADLAFFSHINFDAFFGVMQLIRYGLPHEGAYDGLSRH